MKCALVQCNELAARDHYCFDHWDWVFNELAQDKYRTEPCPPSEGWKAPDRSKNQMVLL